jgi:UDP-glucose 4-epimerase
VAARLPRLVYASSSSVYGDNPDLPLREEMACHPVSPYGVTKLAAEHLVNLYHRNHGLPVASLRYFTVYGPRQRPDMAFQRFLAAAHAGAPVELYGDGSQTRDFTFVDDIVSATRAAGDQGRPGGVYNVGGGERIALREVLALIEDVTGRRLRVERGPAQKGDMRDTFADTTAACRDLGFRSTVGLREGLARQWAWIREAS